MANNSGVAFSLLFSIIYVKYIIPTFSMYNVNSIASSVAQQVNWGLNLSQVSKTDFHATRPELVASFFCIWF